MLKINMEQQYAKIGLDIQKPQLNLKTTQAQLMIHTESATVEIKSIPGKLEIDQTPCRYSFGIKNNTDFSRDYAREGMQAALEAIGKIAEDGDRLAAIEKRGNPIVELAQEANIPPETSITWAYKEPPIINYEPGRVEYNPNPGQVNIEVQEGSVENNSEAGKVNVYIQQYNSLRIWTTGSMNGGLLDKNA